MQDTNQATGKGFEAILFLSLFAAAILIIAGQRGEANAKVRHLEQQNAALQQELAETRAQLAGFQLGAATVR